MLWLITSFPKVYATAKKKRQNLYTIKWVVHIIYEINEYKDADVSMGFKKPITFPPKFSCGQGFFFFSFYCGPIMRVIRNMFKFALPVRIIFYSKLVWQHRTLQATFFSYIIVHSRNVQLPEWWLFDFRGWARGSQWETWGKSKDWCSTNWLGLLITWFHVY